LIGFYPSSEKGYIVVEKKVIILPSAMNFRNDFVKTEKPEVVIPGKGEKFPGALQLLKAIRKESAEIVRLLSPDVQTQEKLILADLIALFAKGRNLSMVDIQGKERNITWRRFILEDIPYLIPEVLLGIYHTFKIWKHARYHLRKFKGSGIIRFPFHEKSPVGYIRTNLNFGVKAGGSVSHTAGVINSLLQMGYPVHYFAPELLPTINIEHCLHEIIPPPRMFNAFESLRCVSYSTFYQNLVHKRLKDVVPGLLYHRYNLGSYVLRPLADCLKSGAVLEFNSSEIWKKKNWEGGLSYLERLLFPVLRDIELANLHSANLVVTVSDVMKDQIVNMGVNPEKILSNPNGVDVHRFIRDLSNEDKSIIRSRYSIPSDTIILTFVGTFGLWHGISVLAEAIAPIIQRRKDIHFVLVGDGALKPDLEKAIMENNLTDYVTLTGMVPPHEIPDLLMASDILLSPHVPNKDGSRFFGSPTKLFEYMASGKAIIASDLDQIGEILENDKTAILTTPGNVKDLVDAIISLSGDTEKCRRLGYNARILAEKKYSWEAHTARIINAVAR